MGSKNSDLIAFYNGLGFTTGSLADRERQFMASKGGYLVGKSNAQNQLLLTTDHRVKCPLDPTKVP
jgi:hypothetical protein